MRTNDTSFNINTPENPDPGLVKLLLVMSMLTLGSEVFEIAMKTWSRPVQPTATVEQCQEVCHGRVHRWASQQCECGR